MIVHTAKLLTDKGLASSIEVAPSAPTTTDPRVTSDGMMRITESE